MKWNRIKLGRVVNNLDSRRKPLNDRERARITTLGLYPYIGANNIMGYVDQYLFDESILCVAEDGGSWGASQKCATIYSGKTWVNNHAHVLTATDKLDLRYLMYFLNYTDLTKYISGSTRGKLTKSSLENIDVPLPPLHVQEQIADTLDKADALRRKDQELLQKYDELAQSIFYDMFGDPVRNEKGWKSVRGKEAFVFSSGRFNPTKNLDNSYPYPTYGGNGITGYSKEKLIDYPTIVIGRVGAYCGSIHRTKKSSWITDNAIYIKAGTEKFDLDFLLFLFKKQNLNQYAAYSGQPKITQKPLENILFINPPLEIQKKFGHALSSISKSKDIIVNGFTEDLFEVVTGKYFS